MRAAAGGKDGRADLLRGACWTLTGRRATAASIDESVKVAIGGRCLCRRRPQPDSLCVLNTLSLHITAPTSHPIHPLQTTKDYYYPHCRHDIRSLPFDTSSTAKIPLRMVAPLLSPLSDRLVSVTFAPRVQDPHVSVSTQSFRPTYVKWQPPCQTTHSHPITAARSSETHPPPPPLPIFCLCGDIDPLPSSTFLPPQIPATITCTTCPHAQYTPCLFSPSRIPDLSNYRCPYRDPNKHKKRLKKRTARLWNEYLRKSWEVCGRHLWSYYAATVFLHCGVEGGDTELQLEPQDFHAS